MIRLDVALGLVVALGTFGCDALVGGVCAAGYVRDGSDCVFAAATIPADGGGGQAGAPSVGGAGGDDPHPIGGAGGGDPPTCPPALDLCDGVCVDLASDPSHCGECGSVCSTGLCVEGACEDDPTGHAVIIGMSYAESTAASRRLLGNALFLPLSEPLRFLDYRQYAEPPTAAAVDVAVDEQATLRNRTYQRLKVENLPQLASEMATGSYDAVLIHDQPHATENAMTTAGAYLAPVLASFAEQGGVIVVLASHAGPAMPSFLSASDLLATFGVTALDGSLLTNAAPTDAIGIGVASPFFASTHATGFLLDEPTGPTLVPVVTGYGLPVVLHRAILP